MDAFDPRYRMTEAIHQGMRAIERADHDLARLAPSRGSLLQRMRRGALARNAFATATIEGNPLTMPEVESLLRAGPSPARANSKDELEILNYVEFMERPEARKAPREPADVLRVHAALFRHVFKDAGAWKTRANFIGKRPGMSVVFVPTSPERVERELAAAIDWLHDARDHPPLVRALLFHHEFESIHPFRDGNGRAGRAITPMALHELGYEGSAFAQIDYQIYRRRAEYYESLAAVERAQFEDHTPWLEFMVSVVARAYGDAVELARFERALPEELTERQRRVADWFAVLEQESPEARVKFNDVHQAFPEVPARTLKRD
ncbi:MAG TPA: Fic family protein, partial [Planctomycetota bacterium]|nr:Fic family protein [Planctomycetota bacterium]